VAPRWRGALRPQQLAAGGVDVGEEEGASEIVALGEEGGQPGKLVVCRGGGVRWGRRASQLAVDAGSAVGGRTL
jgi:hypothetical protein